MTMPRLRVRIGTLMLLIAIAALAIALVVERRKSAALLADRERARQAAELSAYYGRLFRAQLVQAAAGGPKSR